MPVAPARRSPRWPSVRRVLPVLAAAVLAVGGTIQARPAPAWLSAPESLAPGVEYFTSTDRTLVDPAAPVAAFLLKLNPAVARLSSVHAHDELMGTEPLVTLAERHGAVAAVNGGFFNTQNGGPVAVLKEGGELVGESAAIKGAVVIRSPDHGRTELDFDQMAATVAVAFDAAGRSWSVPVDGIDTTRARGKLMLYTPHYHGDTDTAPTGTEWAFAGQPARVTAVRRNAGHTPIPSDGGVLSYGGADLPEALAALAPDVRLTFKTTWRTIHGLSTKTIDKADAIVSGAGLLRWHGHALDGWDRTESLNVQAFITTRHPRTIIGVDRHGAIWLAVVDGRQPAHSVGMQFSDLERLCDRLELTDALNLDGGGSTAMVIHGRIVNTPSDASGPRPVGDALLVTTR